MRTSKKQSRGADRRAFLRCAGQAAAVLSVGPYAASRALAQASRVSEARTVAYVGSYTTERRDGSGRGISVYRIDDASGQWKLVELVANLVNPSFLARDREGRFLYAVHGDMDYATAFVIDPASGRLAFLNQRHVGGMNPVFLAVDPSNRFVVTSNYSSGSLAVLPIEPDGSLGPLSELVELEGEPGPNPAQTGSLPHDNPFDPAGRYMVVPDKGLDKVFVFRLDTQRAALVPGATPFVTMQAGAGPRHAAFHPTLPVVYVNNELDSTVAVFDFDSRRGALAQRQVLSTLPEDFHGVSTTAEIAVHASGRFVYVSNRGHDSVTTFAVDPGNGELRLRGFTSTQGQRPRFFSFDPAGSQLHVCNEVTDTIVTFSVDATSGVPEPTGRVIETGSPVSIVYREA